MASISTLTISLTMGGHEEIYEIPVPYHWKQMSEEERIEFIDGSVAEAKMTMIDVSWAFS